MKDILGYLKDKSILCEIYNSADDAESFYVGYVLYFDDENFVIESITSVGTHDGFYCLPLESIITIKYNTIYTSNIAKLIINNFEHKAIKLKNNKLFRSFIDYIILNNCICEIETCGGSFALVGHIVNFTESKLSINLIDENGCADGIGVIKVDDITCMSVDTENLKKLKIFES